MGYILMLVIGASIGILAGAILKAGCEDDNDNA